MKEIMKLFSSDSVYKNEITSLLKAFYPFEVFEDSDKEQSDLRCTVSDAEVSVAHFVDGKNISVKRLDAHLLDELNGLEGRAYIIQAKVWLKGLIYDLASEITGRQLPWGILTGIRPTKLAYKLYRETGSEVLTIDKLMKVYRISREKSQLLVEVIVNEMPFMEAKEGDRSIYIGIPFCPSKCSYCTFPSYQADKWPAAYEAYTEVLLAELEGGKVFFDNCTSVYIGGGTPTSLTEENFRRLMEKVRELIGDRDIEFTVEAGRPDSITTGKLAAMRDCGVNRISINPQTMQDRTLAAIGRRHNAEDIVRSFKEARDMGFDHINMDLILGLPGELALDVKDTMEKVIDLGPESITVHTLAFKRGSKMSEDRQELLLDADRDIHESLGIVQTKMAEAGYMPYYLYRQKQMVGQYENVGYCKPGHESIYNIRIMEEVEDVVAFGAGAISKKIRDGKISRMDQPKDVKTYLEKSQEILEKKQRFFIVSS